MIHRALNNLESQSEKILPSQLSFMPSDYVKKQYLSSEQLN